MRNLLFLAFLVGCNEQGFSKVSDYGGVYESSLSGRVCDADSGRWLPNAVVYTHILNDADELIDTRETYSDENGQWQLEELRGDQLYTVYVQYGNEIVDMFDIEVGDSADVEVPSEACGAALGRVAVITGNYDDWEVVLPEIGVTNYEVIQGIGGEELGQFLSDPANLAEFGALFFAGGHVEEDVLYDSDGSDTAGVVTAVQTAVTDYVATGGLVFASDWSYDLLELCWPDSVDFVKDDNEPDAAQLGTPQTVTANITQPGLENVIERATMDISFDLDTWPVVKSVDSDNVQVYIQAEEVALRDGTDELSQTASPLLLDFTPGDGRVIFSSFRMASNLDGRRPAMLRYVLGADLRTGSGE
jgi:hypothetical protein